MSYYVLYPIKYYKHLMKYFPWRIEVKITGIRLSEVKYAIQDLGQGGVETEYKVFGRAELRNNL